MARRADIGAGQIYRWRKELCTLAGFAPILIAPPDTAAAAAAGGAVCGEPAIEVDFAGKARVRTPGSVPAELATAVVKALSRR